MTAVMDGLPSICASALWISQIRLSTIWPATAKVKAHSRNIMAASAGMIIRRKTPLSRAFDLSRVFQSPRTTVRKHCRKRIGGGRVKAGLCAA